MCKWLVREVTHLFYFIKYINNICCWCAYVPKVQKCHCLFLGCLHQRCLCVVWWWKNSAEARLGRIKSNLFIETDLKLASKPVWPHPGVPQYLTKFCLRFCPLLYQKSSWILNLGNLQVTTLFSLPVRAFLKSLRPHLPSSSHWTLWWIEGSSIQ